MKTATVAMSLFLAACTVPNPDYNTSEDSNEVIACIMNTGSYNVLLSNPQPNTATCRPDIFNSATSTITSDPWQWRCPTGYICSQTQTGCTGHWNGYTATQAYNCDYTKSDENTLTGTCTRQRSAAVIDCRYDLVVRHQ